MTLFWALAGGMIVLAFVFLLPPLMRRPKRNPISLEQLNIDVIKQQLTELDADLKNGKLDPSDYTAAKIDLEKELLYDVSETANVTSNKPEKLGRWASIVLVVAIPVAAVLLYQHVGLNRLIAPPHAEKSGMEKSNPSAAQAPSIEEMVAKLATKLEAQPNDPKGWFMLARSYMAMNRYTEAANAYRRLHELVGDQPEILVSYADALAMVHNGKLAGKPIELINKALELDPAQPQGLWLAGMAADQRGDHQTAIHLWRRLEPLLVNDPNSQKEINQLITQAEQQDNSASKASNTIPTNKPASTIRQDSTSANTVTPEALTVSVTLDPALVEQATPNDALFVFAQVIDGSPMPLAVVRKQVKHLPLKVTLDDSMAMMPTMRLSNFSEVRVGARISKSGNATPQSGDLYGEVAPVSVIEGGTVQISIEKQIP